METKGQILVPIANTEIKADSKEVKEKPHVEGDAKELINLPVNWDAIRIVMPPIFKRYVMLNFKDQIKDKKNRVEELLNLTIKRIKNKQNCAGTGVADRDDSGGNDYTVVGFGLEFILKILTMPDVTESSALLTVALELI